MPPDHPRRLLFVCDFASVHSRTYVDYFAKRPAGFEVQVLSTTPAAPMPNVEVVELAPRGTVSEAARSGFLGRLAYTGAGLAPGAYAAFRLHESVAAVRRNLARVRSLATEVRPDVIHAFRTHPEGVIAWRLKQALGPVPLFLSTWGQDLVVWARRNRVLARWTRELMAEVDVLLPDNVRDGDLARLEFGLPEGVPVKTLPAPGGLDVEDLRRLEAGFGVSALPGEPKLLSTRGYQNIYLRTRVLFEAFARFRTAQPEAMLYVDGPRGHPGEAAHYRWMRRYRVADAARQLHLTRPQLLEYMGACDFYVSSSLSDGLPMSLLEAMYFGQIPIVTRHESVLPLIHEGENGFTVSGQSPEEIVGAWERALELVERRPQIREENRALLAARYSRDSNLAVVAEMYQAMAGGRPSDRRGGAGRQVPGEAARVVAGVSPAPLPPPSGEGPVHLLIEAVGMRRLGGATVLLDVLGAVAESGRFDRVTVLGAPARERSFDLPDLAGLRVQPRSLADRSIVLRALFYLVWFRRVARRVDPDVILSLSGMAWAPTAPTAVLIQRPMPFYPEAAATFGPQMRFRFRVIRRLMRYACRRAAAVLVQSEEMRRVVGQSFGLADGCFRVQIPCATEADGGLQDPAVAAAMLRVPTDRRLLYVGSDAPHKNLGLLADGVGLLRAQLPGATLFATLPVDHPLGRTEGVVCLGVLGRAGVSTAYRLASMVCQASFAETVGLALLEAMAAGVPVLAADRPYAREMCGNAAGYFDPCDPVSFAAEAAALVGGGELAERRRAEGRAIMSARQEERPYRRMVDQLFELGRAGSPGAGEASGGR